MTPDPDRLADFARRYAAAWCGQDPTDLALLHGKFSAAIKEPRRLDG
jgi:hypothetical protein